MNATLSGASSRLGFVLLALNLIFAFALVGLSYRDQSDIHFIAQHRAELPQLLRQETRARKASAQYDNLEKQRLELKQEIAQLVRTKSYEQYKRSLVIGFGRILANGSEFSVNHYYGALFRSLRLTRVQLNDLKELLAESQQTFTTTPNIPPEYSDLYQSGPITFGFEALQDDFQRVLGPQDYATLKTYSASLNSRKSVIDINQAYQEAGIPPLDDATQDKLTATFSKSNFPPLFPKDATDEDFEAFKTAYIESAAQAALSAKEVLTADQLSKFQSSTDARINELMLRHQLLKASKSVPHEVQQQ